MLLRIVLQDSVSEVTKVYPPSKLKVFLDDITASMEERDKEFVGIAEKVLKSKKKQERRVKGLKLSVTGGGKEGKTK